MPISIGYPVLIAVLLIFQASSSSSSCVDLTSNYGKISNHFVVKGGTFFSKCWKISNPDKQQVQLNISSIGFYGKECFKGNITITSKSESRVWTFCNDSFTKQPILTFEDVEVKHFVRSEYYNNDLTPNFTLTYEKQGQLNTSEARLKAISWVYGQRSPIWDWRENTLKAVTALFLSGAVNLSHGVDLSKELMVKQAELRVAISLQRDVVSEIDLSMFVHFLLVTCNKPRYFAYHDFIEHLHRQVESSGNTTHPIAYLALCNANETWPSRAIADLSNILNIKSEYPFAKDIQAFAVMAVACKVNQTKEFGTNSDNRSLMTSYKKAIATLKEKLNSDDAKAVSETALLTQALLSAGEYEGLSIYNLTKYDVSNATSFDFQDIYFTLPLFSRKSLADIFKTNCSGLSRRGISDMNRKTKVKIQVPSNKVRYSLFIGDKKDVIHTISISLPANYTAFQVMQLAEVRNPVYQFKWHRESGKMYVHDIAKTPNDPETGKFWLLYLGSDNGETLTHLTKGPDELYLKSEDHLILWYKTVKI